VADKPNLVEQLAEPLAALAVLFVIAGCQTESSPTARSEHPVQVQRVTFESEATSREFVGVIKARYESDLGFRVGGKITLRIVNVGDRVRVGDVVARLDPQDFELQVQSAEAELAAAISNRAQAAADNDRYSSLKDRGFASIADSERKKAAKDEAEGRLERARRALDLARNQWGYADLKADADGVITATLAEPGQVVALGQTVVRLAHYGEKEAMIALPETSLGDVPKAKATIRLWSDRDRSFVARLRELSPQADASTRTYAARFTILDADDTVAFGMTATVTLRRPAAVPLARLPLAAIIDRGAGPAVFVVDPSSQLVLKPVTIASFTDAAALVSTGLRDGDLIVTLGVQKLEVGWKVRPLGIPGNKRDGAS
jgi:RND family efflux transporter MFP subunit